MRGLLGRKQTGREGIRSGLDRLLVLGSAGAWKTVQMSVAEEVHYVNRRKGKVKPLGKIKFVWRVGFREASLGQTQKGLAANQAG